MIHIHSDPNNICCEKPFNSHLDYDIHQARKHCAKTEDGTLICPICKQPIRKYIVNLVKHIRLDHHNSKSYNCENCSRKFDTEDRLKVHVKKIHTDELNYQCDKCEKRFKNPNNLHTHLQKVHGTETIQCDKCEYSCKNISKLKVHQTRVHSSNQIICDKCGKTFTNTMSLKAHKKEVHGKHEQVQCTFEGCELIFNSISKMKKHIQRSHIGVEKKHKCGFCERMFETPSARLAHEKKKHLGVFDIKCEICDFKTVSKGHLHAHWRRVHGNEEYKCDYPGCNKSYGVRGNLYAHKKRVHKVHWAEKFD